MQRPDSLSQGKPAGPAGGAAAALMVAGLLAPATWLLAACGSGEDLMSSVAPPPEQSVVVAPAHGAPTASEGDLQSGTLNVTPTQQGYLDALSSAGVQPSSELRALSIGSSICQARAAGQSPEAVWDYISPLVRSDVADARATGPQAASDLQVNAVTADYIRIATQRLC